MSRDANTKEARASFVAPADLLDRFRKVAESEDRTMSAELRRLMAARVAEAEAKDDEPVGATA